MKILNSIIHKSKKAKLNFLIISGLLLLLGVLSIYNKGPYGNIEVSNIRTIKFHSDFYANIDGEPLENADVEKCIQLLNEIKDFKQLPSYLTIYDIPLGACDNGFDLEFKDGNQLSIYINNGELIIENQRFDANKQDIAEFELFFYNMLSKYFPKHDYMEYVEKEIEDLQKWLSSN